MKPITRWFKGTSVHGGERKYWGEPGPGEERCLWMVCQSGEEVTGLAAVVAQLFPERACACPDGVDLIHFNNHPDTTRDQIDKILHTYTMEEEVRR